MCPLDCSVAGAGDDIIVGDSVGIMPQGPGQQPMGAAQLAALLRCVFIAPICTQVTLAYCTSHLLDANPIAVK
jgi:hypothetical protein